MISPTMALERARKPGWKEALRARFMRDFDNEGLWRELEQALFGAGSPLPYAGAPRAPVRPL